MVRDISVDEACGVLRAAFAPFPCGVETLADGMGVRFIVSDPDGNDPLTSESIPAVVARRPRELRDIISATRAKVMARGFKLDPWSFPKIANVGESTAA